MSEWRYRFLINDAEFERCSVRRPLRITHGRSAIGMQPQAPTTGFDWIGANPPGQIGDTLQITLDLVDQVDATWRYDEAGYRYDEPGYKWDNVGTWPQTPRFTGEITALQAQETGDGAISGWRVECTGRAARLGYQRVSGAFPQETDVARVQRIAAAAGIPISIRGNAGVQLAADPEVDEHALPLLHAVCASTGGLLWQDRDGTIWYGTADHRLTDAAGVLTECAIAHGLEWEQPLDEIVNTVTVSWGPDDDRRNVTHRDDLSVDMWGERALLIQTECAAQADADQLGLLIIARRAWPYHTLTRVMSPVSEVPRVEQLTLASMEVGTILLAPISHDPTVTPAPLVAWVVEGWVEEADRDGRVTMQLVLADADRWVQTRLRTWGEAAQATWAQEAADSWLDALIVEVGT